MRFINRAPLLSFIAVLCSLAPMTNKAHAQPGLDDTFIPGFQAMAEQLTIATLHQAQLIGMMIDARTQLDTQRTLQKMMAKANKDYLPSEALCKFGTGTKSIAQTDHAAHIKKIQVSNFLNARQTLAEGTAAGEAGGSDHMNRFREFRKLFCDKGDLNNKLGLVGTPVCTATTSEVRNWDIDFTRTLDANPLVKLDFTDANATPQESAIFALGSNLYGANLGVFSSLNASKLPRNIGPQKSLDPNASNFMRLREVIAMRSVAQNSYASQVALKDRGAEAGVKPFMEAAFKGMGVPDADLKYFLGDAGEGPSYDTQMNYLTKAIYQDPNFYTNLIDKPINIDRQRASMSAFGLMQKRDLATALLRREMLLSTLIEVKLRNNPSISRPAVTGGATVRGVMGIGQ